MAWLINKGLEASIAKKTVTYDFVRHMKVEGQKNVNEVKRSEFANAVIANL